MAVEREPFAFSDEEMTGLKQNVNTLDDNISPHAVNLTQEEYRWTYRMGPQALPFVEETLKTGDGAWGCVNLIQRSVPGFRGYFSPAPFSFRQGRALRVGVPPHLMMIRSCLESSAMRKGVRAGLDQFLTFQINSYSIISHEKK